MGVLVSALATGAATYAARKATPKTTNENYNFGGEDAEDTGIKAPKMASTYLGNQNAQNEPEPKRIKAPWEVEGAGLGTGTGMGSRFG